MLTDLKNRFWAWYERNYALNVSLAAGLFSLQLVHLYWLTTDVVLPRLGFASVFFTQSDIFKSLLVLVDYTEIPALILTSILYISLIRKDRSAKDMIYLVFLNTQWIHIFWITDEVVVNLWQGDGLVANWTPAAAWVAILIDYLELPVIYETIKSAVRDHLPSRA